MSASKKPAKVDQYDEMESLAGELKDAIVNEVANNALAPLGPILEMPATGHPQRENFIEAVMEWATSTAPLRAAEVENLPEIPRMIRVLYWFRNDMISSGFWYFLSESWGVRHWADLRHVLETIRAIELLPALDAVEQLFPAGFPMEEEPMRAMIEEFESRTPDPLRVIDRQYRMFIDEQVPVLLQRYLVANREEVEQAHAAVL